MNATDPYQDRSLIKLNQQPIKWTLPLLLLLPPTIWAGGVVTNCTEANLRATMSRGGLVTFACGGTILLSATITNEFDTVLNGGGHQVIISGGDSVRIFWITPNKNLTLLNLTITRGSADAGGGVFNDGGNLAFTDCVFAGNAAVQRGGAICSQGGNVCLENCSFYSNSAAPPLIPTGITVDDVIGGAVANSGTFVANLCTFVSNSTIGGRGDFGGFPGTDAKGGAICNLGTLELSGCTFLSNSVAGGPGGFGTGAGPVPGSGGGSGGGGGSGYGSGLFNAGTARLVNCFFMGNSGCGGTGGLGGNGYQGNATTPGGWGGRGGNGGSSYGTVSSVNNSCFLTNCTIAWNSSTNGAGGAGGVPGSGHPPGASLGPGSDGGVFGTVFSSNCVFQLVNCTMALNSSFNRYGDPAWYGGLNTPGALILNSILATNLPGPSCVGPIHDAGHNLSSDGSSALTNTSTLRNTAPLLGPPANNGGPTLTMALQPGSPAIDAGDPLASPQTDQRGYLRPAGSAADIGAFECNSISAFVTIGRAADSSVNILAKGDPGVSCLLAASTNLSDWQFVATNRFGQDRTILFVEECGASPTQRFFRVSLP